MASSANCNYWKGSEIVLYAILHNVDSLQLVCLIWGATHFLIRTVPKNLHAFRMLSWCILIFYSTSLYCDTLLAISFIIMEVPMNQGRTLRYKRPQACHLTVDVVRFSKPWHIKLEELWRDTFLLWEDRGFFLSWGTYKMGHEVLHSACSHASDIAWLNILFYSSCVRKLHIIYTIPRLINYARYHTLMGYFLKSKKLFTEKNTTKWKVACMRA